MLTYNNLTGLGGFSDLIGTAHLRVTDSTQDEYDEAGAAPVVVRKAQLMFLPCAENRNILLQKTLITLFGIPTLFPV